MLILLYMSYICTERDQEEKKSLKKKPKVKLLMRSTYAQLCQPSVFNGVLQDAVYIYIVSIWVFQEHYEYCHYIRTNGGN